MSNSFQKPAHSGRRTGVLICICAAVMIAALGFIVSSADSDVKETPPAADSDVKETSPAADSDVKETPPAANSDVKETPPAADSDTKETSPAVSFLVNGEEAVSLWDDGKGTAYVFLPSYADPAKTLIVVPDRITVKIDGASIQTGMDCAAYSAGQAYSLDIPGVSAKQLVFLHSENTAALFINTAEGAMDRVHADKGNEESAELILRTPEGVIDYSGGGTDRIKGRGNSTWKLDKKPYNLKLEQKTDLLSLGEAKKWSLLANAYDETNLRNKIVLDFARQIAPYNGFAPECAFVDVYANEEYMGLYLLCRSIKDVTAEFMDTASEDAYAFELTMAVKVAEEDVTLPLNEAMAMEISYPDPFSEDCAEQLGGLISELETWLKSDDPLPETLHPDLNSWARKILLEVIFENYDSPNASQFFWGSLKDRTIFAGPCWDYDLSMGTFYINWSTPYAFMAFKDWNLGKDISWYHGMWEKAEVREAALKIYKEEFRERLYDLLDSGIEKEADLISAASTLDKARWPAFYAKYENYSQAVEDMAGFMRERVRFLENYWQDPSAYRRLTMKLPNTRMLHLYVKAGEVCESLPLPNEVSLAGEGMEGVSVWYVEGTDKAFDTDTAITEDLTLYALSPE